MANGPNGSDTNDILTSFAGDLGQTCPPLMNKTVESQFDAFENPVLIRSQRQIAAQEL
jgi:hypothetical protein